MKKNKKTIHYSCISLCFCAGLVFTIFVSVHLYSINLSNSFLVVAFAFFFTLLNCFVFKKFGRVFFAVLAGVLFALLRVEKINQDRKHSIDFVGRQHDIELTISNAPTIKQNNWHFESDSLIIDGEKLQSPTYISLSAGDFSLDSGDKLTLRASPSVGFGKYALSISKPELILISKPDPPSFFLRLKNSFSSKLERLFGASKTDELALALGYLTGQKSYLSDELSNKLKIVGLSHVVVASGFHLGIMTEIAKKTFGKLSRFGTIFSSAITIICFVSITGLSASMLRAALVCSLSLWAWYFGRKFHPARLLLFAAAISLIINPLYIKNLAWQLSFASFAGLLLLAPLLKDFFYGSEKISFIGETFIQSGAAQLCCLPLSIYNFGSFSLIGLISNLIIPPTIPLAMLLSVFSVIFAPIPKLGDFLVFLAETLLGFHVWIIDKLSSLKFGFIELKSNESYALLLFLIPVLLFLILKLRTKFDFRPLLIKPPLLEKSQKDGRIYSC